MAGTIAPEYAKFVADQRRAGRLGKLRVAAEGEIGEAITITAAQITELLSVSARRAAGLVRPSKHTEVLWVEGESELAVSLNDWRVKLASGLILLTIPVRCDQTGAAVVEVPFVCGTADQPAGLYFSTLKRPNGPEIIVATWGDALVAFAWQCLLGAITGVAGATGKDRRGNLLVPVEISANARAITLVPMARHRFTGSSGLKPTAVRR